MTDSNYPAGATGPGGGAGSTGSQGSTGASGAHGSAGATGATGADGSNGAVDFFAVKEGANSPQLGRMVQTIVLQDADVIVYIDDEFKIRIECNDEYGDYPLGVLDIWPDVKIAQARPLDNLRAQDKKTFVLLVAQALAEVVEKDGDGVKDAEKMAAERLAGANQMLQEANAFRASRLAEISRRWHLLYSLGWCAMWLILALIAWLCRDELTKEFGARIPIVINCMAFGVFGAFVSVCLRLGKLVATPESGWALHLLEAGVRIVVGGAAGIAVFLATLTGVVLKDLASGELQVFLIYLVSMVAGLSERALPSLAAQVPGGLGKDLEKDGGGQ